MNKSLPAYRPSGAAGLRTLPGFAIAAVFGVVLAWLYQSLTRWIPLIYINAVTAAGFGAALGYMYRVAIDKGPCRSRIAAMVLALPCSVAALGASYYWGFRHVADQVTEKQPGATIAFVDYIGWRLETGWKVGNHGSTGIPLTGWGAAAVWVAEAVIVIGIAMWMAWVAASVPYCESCEQWTIEKAMLIGGRNRTDAQQRLAEADLNGLVAIGPGDAAGLKLLLTVNVCPRCQDKGWLTVEEVRPGEKGKEKKHTVAHKLTLEPETLHAFQERLQNLNAPPVRAAPA